VDEKINLVSKEETVHYLPFMKTMKTPLAIALLIGLVGGLTGCATQQFLTSEAPSVPVSRVYAENMTKPIKNGGLVIIKRDIDLSTPNCLQRLRLNGRPLADIDHGEKFQLYLHPGLYLLHSQTIGTCHNGEAWISFTLETGQTSTIRLGENNGGDVVLQHMAF
jgi:hypothetical protein